MQRFAKITNIENNNNNNNTPSPSINIKYDKMKIEEENKIIMKWTNKYKIYK